MHPIRLNVLKFTSAYRIYLLLKVMLLVQAGPNTTATTVTQYITLAELFNLIKPYEL